MTVWEVIQKSILDSLDKNVVPWRATWSDMSPVNYVSGKRYNGLNMLLLAGGESPYYLTRKQIESKGGKLIDDSKHRIAVFFRVVSKREDGDEWHSDSGYPVIRYYKVYNLAQTDIPVPNEHNNVSHVGAEELVAGYRDKPTINHVAVDPHYVISKDIINLPPIESFDTSNDYYATLFHELVHSTGHHTRLNRFKDERNTNINEYSEEELVAEMGACFLRAISGVTSREEAVLDSSVDYIKLWHGRISKDVGVLREAVKKATAAAKYIAGDGYYE